MNTHCFVASQVSEQHSTTQNWHQFFRYNRDNRPFIFWRSHLFQVLTYFSIVRYKEILFGWTNNLHIVTKAIIYNQAIGKLAIIFYRQNANKSVSWYAFTKNDIHFN